MIFILTKHVRSCGIYDLYLGLHPGYIAHAYIPTRGILSLSEHSQVGCRYRAGNQACQWHMFT
jgi:hypothetical protein